MCVEVGRVHVNEGRDRLQTKTKNYNVILACNLYITSSSPLE